MLRTTVSLSLGKYSKVGTTLFGNILLRSGSEAFADKASSG